SPNDRLPVAIHGIGPHKGKCRVSIEESSQFASGVIMSARVGGWEVEVIGENAEESPYVAMTSSLVSAFPKRGGTLQIEQDASSGSYFLATSLLAKPTETMEYSPEFGIDVATTRWNTVKVLHWPSSRWQMDEKFPIVISRISQACGFDIGSQERTRIGALLE